MSNRKLGTDFEREFCEILHAYGWWAYNLAQKPGGQPFDVLCANYGSVWAVDCKVCSNNRFDFKRVEQNQLLAMESWEKRSGRMAWFALKLSDGSIYMVDYRRIRYLMGEESSMNESQIRSHETLEEWIE